MLFGQAGADRFKFSGPGHAHGDKVMDFVKGTDRFDFSVIDPMLSTGGNQAFSFQGYKAASYTGSGGQLWIEENAATGYSEIHFRISSTTTEYVVEVKGLGLGLTASDFVL